MNLVVKEYCASNITADGVLILSEFAGAAPQMQANSLLVNPYHVEEVAAAIAAACDMIPPEKERRMKALRRKVRETDIYWWLDSLLSAGFAGDLMAFASLEDYMPRENTLCRQLYHAEEAWMRRTG
jgi:trehalose-6-phosphate synthase